MSTTGIEEELSSEKTALGQIKGLLNQLLRITTNDGRIFVGTFAGTDKPLNLILLNAEEFRISELRFKSDGRFVGQVIFPWKVVVKVEARIEQDAESRRADNGWYFWFVKKNRSVNSVKQPNGQDDQYLSTSGRK